MATASKKVPGSVVQNVAAIKADLHEANLLIEHHTGRLQSLTNAVRSAQRFLSRYHAGTLPSGMYEDISVGRELHDALTFFQETH